MASTCNELLDLCLRGQPWSSELLDRAIAEDDGPRAVLDRGRAIGRSVRAAPVRRVRPLVSRGDRTRLPRTDSAASPRLLPRTFPPSPNASTCSRGSRWAPMSPSPASCSTPPSAGTRRRKSCSPGRARTMSCSRPIRASLIASSLRSRRIVAGSPSSVRGAVVRRWDRDRPGFAPHAARPDPRLPGRSLLLFREPVIWRRRKRAVARSRGALGGRSGSTALCCSPASQRPAVRHHGQPRRGRKSRQALDDDFERQLLQMLAGDRRFRSGRQRRQRGGARAGRACATTRYANARRRLRSLRRRNRAIEIVRRLRFCRRPRRVRLRSSADQHRQGLRQRAHGCALAAQWNGDRWKRARRSRSGAPRALATYTFRR